MIPIFQLLRSLITSNCPIQLTWENYSLWFCPFALLPFCFLPLCPFVLLPSCHCPCPPPWLSLSFCGYQEKTFFVIVFTFRLMCRYRRLSWCYSCLHRWQLRPSSFNDKLRLCPFWLQILKLYLNIWRLGDGQGAIKCRLSWDLRIWIANAKYCLFWHLSV